MERRCQASLWGNHAWVARPLLQAQDPRGRLAHLEPSRWDPATPCPTRGSSRRRPVRPVLRLLRSPREEGAVERVVSPVPFAVGRAWEPATRVPGRGAAVTCCNRPGMLAGQLPTPGNFLFFLSWCGGQGVTELRGDRPGHSGWGHPGRGQAQRRAEWSGRTSQPAAPLLGRGRPAVR